jgi:outer membrane protein assembly factor BamB
MKTDSVKKGLSITRPMKFKYLVILTIFLVSSLFLSACAGGATVASSWPGLTSDEESAYVAFNNHVYAVQLENGTQRWRFPAERDNSITFYADPALSPDGQLIVGSYNKILYSLDPESGASNWQFSEAENRYIASPLVNDLGIFAPAADENLYALTLSGQSQWKFTSQDEAWARPAAGNDCDCLYVPAMDHTVYAVDPENGAQIWQSEELGGAIVGEPALSEDGILYTGTFGSEIIAINAQNGSVLWRVPTDGWIWSGPTLIDDRLYFGDLEGNFYALSAEDGSEIWQLTPEQLGGEIVGSPLVVEDEIYLATQNGNLYNLDTTGKIIWTQAVGGPLYTTPRLAGDMILVAPVQTDELLVAYSREGVKQWGFIPPE